MRFSTFLLCLLTLAGCSSKPNVLLITFDTTRADHIGHLSKRIGLTPAIDDLASRGTSFSACYSSQPLTMPSHATIMTGNHPYVHGVRNNGTYILGKENTTLAERLRSAGYATHAIVSAFVLDSQFALDQGFETYDDDLSGGPKQKMFMFKEIQAEQTADKAIRWLRKKRPKDKPFFLWTHFFDPHADYEPPKPYADRFAEEPYRGEIAYADRHLGRILAELKSLGLEDDTLVVFTSDHGEGLGEHGENTHGIFVYDSTMRVPLVLAGRGVPEDKTIAPLVRSVDIVPTILEIVGIKTKDAFEGKSLKEVWSGRSEERLAYSEALSPLLNFGWSEIRSLRSAKRSVIQAPRPEAYDLSADPREQVNLLRGSTIPEGTRPLLVKLQQITRDDPFTRGGHRQSPLDKESRDRLAALGYVSGPEITTRGPRPDPKDRIVYWERFQNAQGLVRARRYQEALEAIRPLVHVDPENVIALGSLANVLMRTRAKDEALEIFRRMITLDPKRETPYLGAARILRERGDTAEAVELIHAVIKMQPANPDGYAAMGDLHLEQNRYPEAETWFRKALEKDPHSAMALSGLGNCLNRAGRMKEALAVLKPAYERDPTSSALGYNLAVVLDRLGNTKAAAQQYQKTLRNDPEHAMSWNNLGSLLDRLGKRPEAIRMIARAHEIDPQNVEATYNLGALLLVSGKPAAALPLFEQALAERPTLFQAAAQRARALELLGRREESIAAWRQLAASRPAAWLQVAKAELAAGRTVAARTAIQRARAANNERINAAIQQDPALRELL